MKTTEEIAIDEWSKVVRGEEPSCVWFSREEIEKTLNRFRSIYCDVSEDGCKDSPGLCDSCNLIEALEDEWLNPDNSPPVVDNTKECKSSGGDNFIPNFVASCSKHKKAFRIGGNGTTHYYICDECDKEVLK